MKIKDQNGYYALLCDTSKWEPKYVSKKHSPLICGVFGSRREAKECADAVKDCPAVHKIVKCSVSIEYGNKSKAKKAR